MGHGRVRRDLGSPTALQPDLLIVGRGGEPCSCSSCDVGRYGDTAQNSDIEVHVGGPGCGVKLRVFEESWLTQVQFESLESVRQETVQKQSLSCRSSPGWS